jgi:signal transduction histidine kinase
MVCCPTAEPVLGASPARLRSLTRALDEQRFLARIGEIFASSLDPEETVTRIAEAAVGCMADFVIVHLVEDGGLRRIKVAHADPADAHVTRTIDSLPRDEEPAVSRKALETKQTQLIEVVTDQVLREMQMTDEARRGTEAMNPTSVMVVPLVARDEAIGVIGFVLSDPDECYDAADVKLAEEVARRAALALDNARLYKLASDAIAVRDELLTIVAHDLRNPLAAIHMTAEMMLRRPGAESAASLERSMQTILRSSQRANRLIEDLLELRRAQLGRLPLQREIVGTEQLISDFAETQRALLSAAGLELHLDLPAMLPALWADRDRVSQVFENLLANAMKFTPAGGTITIGGREEPNGLRLWVADSGPGIAPDELPHLFERFWQSREADRLGLGLGLAIAKQVVEAHGGQIWADSQLGNGTTFSFTIPTRAAPTSHVEQQLEPL